MNWSWHSYWGVTAAKVQFSSILDRNSILNFRLHFKDPSGGGGLGVPQNWSDSAMKEEVGSLPNVWEKYIKVIWSWKVKHWKQLYYPRKKLNKGGFSLSDSDEQHSAGKTAGDPAVKDHLKVLAHSYHVREYNQNFFKLFDLSVWPSDLNLLGGWGLYSTLLFFSCISFYEDKKKVTQKGFDTWKPV